MIASLCRLVLAITLSTAYWGFTAHGHPYPAFHCAAGAGIVAWEAWKALTETRSHRLANSNE